MKLHNSLTGAVEEFVPLRAGEVRMYNCGPTVYKRQHIGNFRAFAMADLLRRSLEYLGFSVTQVMNITDVGHLTEDDRADALGEDKLQREAERRARDAGAPRQPRAKRAAPAEGETHPELAGMLQRRLQARVRVKSSGAASGRIEIEYSGAEDLDRIANLLLEGLA